ncbi:MAG TPA: copper resistance protein CopC [Solirubrobacteraceae bacterium]|nr:copper resistance protein CopC [Solirubrobacteraceae bacterium]
MGVVAAVAAATLAVPATAAAHAVLTHSTPHRGATVTEAPPTIVFDFNEPVEVGIGGLRVFDDEGRRVDGGEIVRPNGSNRSAGVKLDGALDRGLYTATFRVVSADGHPVSGGFSFGVGVAVAKGGSAPDVADLLEESEAGPAVEGAYGVARGLHYAALLLLVGAVVFAAVLWPRETDARWPRRLLLGGAATGLLAALAAIGLQGALGAGVSLAHALDRDVLDASLDTRTGQAWAVRAGLWLAVLAVLAAMRRPAFGGTLALMVLAGALVVSLPLAGHAETQDPGALLVPADAVHVLAAGAWLGGLVVLLVAFWRRADGRGAAAATAGFSRLALWAVVAIAAAGLVQAWFYLDGPETLLTSTYGIALLAKIALLAVIVAVAAGNRRRVAALVASGAPGALRAAMRAEVALAALVLAATAVLVRAAPPASVAAGPATSELDLGPMRLEMVIEPATTGPNDFHLYFFDRRTGAQIDRVEEVTVSLTQEEKRIGPIRIEIPRKGPAHYEQLDEALGVPGEWQVQVDARVSEFDAYSARDVIEVRKP